MIEFFDATADEVLALPRDRTVFLFSMGPLEDHGRHLPLGTDILVARGITAETARRIEADLPGWQAVLMPPLPGGIDSNTTQLALTVRPHVARDWLVDQCVALARHEFRYFACVSGNPGPRQLTAIEEASRLFTMRAGPWRGRKARLVSLTSGGVGPAQVRASPFWPEPKEHGARADTSLLLACPGGAERVRESRMAEPDRDPGHGGGGARGRSVFARFFERATHKLAGAWGPSPGAATEEEGRALVAASVDAWWEKFKDVLLRGTNPNQGFRTWYSVLPPNKSFFRAWLLFLATLGLMTFWVLFTLRAWVDGA